MPLHSPQCSERAQQLNHQITQLNHQITQLNHQITGPHEEENDEVDEIGGGGNNIKLAFRKAVRGAEEQAS